MTQDNQYTDEILMEGRHGENVNVGRSTNGAQPEFPENRGVSEAGWNPAPSNQHTDEILEIKEIDYPNCAYNKMRQMCIMQGIEPYKLLREPVLPKITHYQDALRKARDALAYLLSYIEADEDSFTAEQEALDAINKLLGEEGYDARTITG